jgi:hypothetical protein
VREDTVVPAFTREEAQSQPIQFLYFWFNTADDHDPSLRVGNPSGDLRGVVAVYYIFE